MKDTETLTTFVLPALAVVFALAITKLAPGHVDYFLLALVFVAAWRTE